MGLRKDIIETVREILNDRFISEETSSVPDISNSKLTFGNTGLVFEATVLYVDMRGSTELLEKHNKPVVAKLHKAYFQTIVSIANSESGEVRSFNGDSMLVFFQGTSKGSLSRAVKVAMMIKYMISSDEGINKLLETYYSSIDFGIGIDDGKILCAKIGLARNPNNQDLIWIGTPVNKAVVISDSRSNPANVGISSYVYSNLLDWVKYGTRRDYYGNEVKVDMWTQGVIDLHMAWTDIKEIDKNNLIGPDIIRAVNAMSLTASLWNHDVIEKSILYQTYWNSYRDLYDTLNNINELVPGHKRTCRSLITNEITKAYEGMKNSDLATVTQTNL